MQDVAELYLSHLMLPESQSAAAAVDADRLPDGQRARLRSITDAIGLLGGSYVASETMSPLLSEENLTHGLWQFLEAVQSEDTEALESSVALAFHALPHFPQTFQTFLRPVLIEAMIETQHLTLAHSALADLAHDPELAGEPVDLFLRGRLAQVEGRLESAFEAYYQAAAGWEKYATRARLNLADIAINNGGEKTVQAARDVLDAGINTWRGDWLEVAMLEKLVVLNTLTGRTFDALIVNSMLIDRYPGTESATKAISLVERDLLKLYAQGTEGDLSIGDWVNMHMQLVSRFRNIPVFATATEIFANGLRKHSATDLAISEYVRVEEMLATWRARDETIVTSNIQNRVALSKVQAMIDSGRYSQARVILASMSGTLDQGQKDQWGLMLAEIMSKTGDDARIFTAKSDNRTQNFLRQRAYAAWVIGDWQQTLHRYQSLWDTYPNEFRKGDAIYMLIAAQGVGDREIAGRVAAAYSQLAGAVGLAVVVNRMLETPPGLSPLKHRSAIDRIDQASQTLNQLEDNGL